MVTRAYHFHTYTYATDHALSYGQHQIIMFDQYGRWRSWSTTTHEGSRRLEFAQHRTELMEQTLNLLVKLRMSFDLEHPTKVRAGRHSRAKLDRMAYYARGLNELIPMGGEF